jgi:predicted NAD-dependent protein-ADP-ribosyltransferase YbiA (DUF1768 family)
LIQAIEHQRAKWLKAPTEDLGKIRKSRTPAEAEAVGSFLWSQATEERRAEFSALNGGYCMVLRTYREALAQDPPAKAALLASQAQYLVYRHPTDRVLGAVVSKNQSKGWVAAHTVPTFEGANFVGLALMHIREELRVSEEQPLPWQPHHHAQMAHALDLMSGKSTKDKADKTKADGDNTSPLVKDAESEDKRPDPDIQSLTEKTQAVTLAPDPKGEDASATDKVVDKIDDVSSSDGETESALVMDLDPPAEVVEPSGTPSPADGNRPGEDAPGSPK